MYLLCTDVGPVHPTDFSRTRRHPRPEAVPAAQSSDQQQQQGDLQPRGWESFETGGAEPHRAHSCSSHGRDRGSPTIDATSCSWGATDLGPTLLAFGKHHCSLWQGQQAPCLDRMDLLCAEGTLLYIFEGISPVMYTRYIFLRHSRPPMYSDTFWYIYVFTYLCLMDHIFTNVCTCVCVCFFLCVCNMPI
jgi:hypothetical protein